jgi:hypothetical protein
MPTTLEVKFGDALLEHGFTSIPNLVLESYAALGITSNEMLFIIHVWKYWWTDKNHHPSIQRIADTMGARRGLQNRNTSHCKFATRIRRRPKRQLKKTKFRMFEYPKHFDINSAMKVIE